MSLKSGTWTPLGFAVWLCHVRNITYENTRFSRKLQCRHIGVRKRSWYVLVEPAALRQSWV
jgi:hypothetical protein